MKHLPPLRSGGGGVCFQARFLLRDCNFQGFPGQMGALTQSLGIRDDSQGCMTVSSGLTKRGELISRRAERAGLMNSTCRTPCYSDQKGRQRAWGCCRWQRWLFRPVWKSGLPQGFFQKPTYNQAWQLRPVIQLIRRLSQENGCQVGGKHCCKPTHRPLK